jgi:hypothetical protein
MDDCSCVSAEIRAFSRKLRKVAKNFHNVSPVDVESQSIYLSIMDGI